MTCSRSGVVVASSAYVWESRWLASSWLRSGLAAWMLWPTIRVAVPS